MSRGSGIWPLEIRARSQKSRRHAVPARQQGHHPDGAKVRDEELTSGPVQVITRIPKLRVPAPAAPGPYPTAPGSSRPARPCRCRCRTPGPGTAFSGRAVHASVTSSIRPSPRLAANRKAAAARQRNILGPARRTTSITGRSARHYQANRPHKQPQVFGDPALGRMLRSYLP